MCRQTVWRLALLVWRKTLDNAVMACDHYLHTAAHVGGSCTPYSVMCVACAARSGWLAWSTCKRWGIVCKVGHSNEVWTQLLCMYLIWNVTGPLISILFRLTNVRSEVTPTTSPTMLRTTDYICSLSGPPKPIKAGEAWVNQLRNHHVRSASVHLPTSCIYVNKWLEAILMKYVLKHLSKSQYNNDDNIKCAQFTHEINV